MMRIARLTVLPLLIVLLVACGCSSGLWTDRDSKDLRIVEEVWNTVLDSYVESPSLDKEKLAEAAVRGMLESLGDPYTSYLTPAEAEIAHGELEGNFGGIGAIVEIQNGIVTVVSPLPDSPAERAGIKPGDRIIEIDGLSTASMSLTEAVLHIRGEKGTRVTLTILHPGEDVPLKIEIVRDIITVPSVQWEMVGAGDIAHISITSFTEQTHSELSSALRQLLSPDLRGIVLDLRNNGGGLVTSAVDVASQFVNEGVIVYALDNRGSRKDWTVKSGGLALSIPLAVIVNEYTASASEIVAGALQDHQRAPIIGVRTFGKGSMQQVFELSNGGSLHVTFAHWFTPAGHQIQGQGITPDIIVEVPPDGVEGADPQLNRAISWIEEKAP